MTDRLDGLYRAVVTSTTEFLKPPHRLRVSIPSLTDGVGVWAFPCWSLPASSLPRTPPAIGEGVWVSFEDGNPNYPVYMGFFGGDAEYASALVIPTGTGGGEGPAGPRGPAGPSGPAGADGVGVPAGGATHQVLTKASNASYDTVWATPATTQGRTKTTTSFTTGTLTNGGTKTGTVNLGTQYLLARVSTDRSARVRLYLTEADRTMDASRPIGTDPSDNTGIMLEVVTAPGLLTIRLSPMVDGWTTTTVPWSVTNMSGSSAAVLTTIEYFS